MKIKMTKVVCTIGPKSESPEVLKELLLSGMNVMRLNFSHGDHEEHGKRIVTLRKLCKETGKFVAIMLDTKVLKSEQVNLETETLSTILLKDTKLF